MAGPFLLDPSSVAGLVSGAGEQPQLQSLVDDVVAC
jgi:hypothetical protein